MNAYEKATVGIAILSILISMIAIFLAGRAQKINEKMFKRQGVIDLFMAWQGVNEIDKNDLVGPDIIKAANAMMLTASLWNHDIIEKSILYQSYWADYKTLYDQISSIDELIPGHKKTCKNLITKEMEKAYRGMETIDLNEVIQTRF